VRKLSSAGAEIADHTPERVGKMLSAFHGVFRRLAAADCLKIAAVHGYCLGGGMELATFCDFGPRYGIRAVRPAGDQARLFSSRRDGYAASTLLECARPRISSLLVIKSAQERLARLGLITRVVPDDKLAVALDSLLEELQTLSPSVLQLTRKTLGRIHFADFAKQLEEVERVYLTELMQTHDAREGVRAS